MPTGSLLLTGQVLDEPEGSDTIGPLSTPSPSASFLDKQVAYLQAGNNTILLPPNATTLKVIIVPDPTNAVPLSVKKTGSLDTADGLPLAPADWSAFGVPPGLASFILYAGALVMTGTRIEFYG